MICLLCIYCCCFLLWCLVWLLEVSFCLLFSFRDVIVLYSIVMIWKCFFVLWFKGFFFLVGIKVCIVWFGWVLFFICVLLFCWMVLNFNWLIEVFKFFLLFKGWKVWVIVVMLLELVFNLYKFVIDFGEWCFLVVVIGIFIFVFCFDKRKFDFLFFFECWIVGLMLGRNFCFCCFFFLGGYGKVIVNCLWIGDGFFFFLNIGGIVVDLLKLNLYWERVWGKGMIFIVFRVEENFFLYVILLC